MWLTFTVIDYDGQIWQAAEVYTYCTCSHIQTELNEAVVYILKTLTFCHWPIYSGSVAETPDVMWLTLNVK